MEPLDLATSEEDTGLPDNEPLSALQPDDLVQRVLKARKSADRTQTTWRKEAQLDFDFRSGEQWTDEEKAKFAEKDRLDIVFNRIEPTIESICGHEINNRTAVTYLPRNAPAGTQESELLNGASEWVRDQCDAEDEDSDAFGDMLTSGLGWTETKMDYDSNPDGEILIDRVDPLLMRWDPAARKRNLSDRTWNQCDRMMTKAEIEAEWPEKKDEIALEFTTNTLDDTASGEPHNAAEAPLYKNDQSGKSEGDDDERRRIVIVHEWIELVPFWRVLDDQTGQIVEFDEKQYEMLKQAAAKGLVQAPSKAVKQRKRVYKCAYVLGKLLLEQRDSITQKGFTFNCITGRRKRKTGEWYGVVRPMRDPQRFANKFLSQLEAMFRSNSKGGLLVEESAVDNMRELEKKWASMDGVIKVNDGALTGGKIQPKPIQDIPAGPERMMEFAVSSIRDVTGVNLEVLGMADRNQPGILEIQRKESAMTILAPLFGSMRQYRKVQGRVLADLIVKYISDGRIIQINGPEGTPQAVQLMKMPETLDYTVVVDANSNAPDQKAKTFAVMSGLIPAMQSSGFPVPPDILDYAPLPQALISKWRALIQQQQAKGPPPSPEVVKAQAQVQAQVQIAQMNDALQRYKIQVESNLEMFKATMKAQTEAQTKQVFAAIEEQSQIVNAQANQMKAHGQAIESRMKGVAKMVEALSKAHGEQAKARAEAAASAPPPPAPPSIVAIPMDNGVSDLHAQALQGVASAVHALHQSMSKPRKLKIVRDGAGNISEVQ
jgi:hypothetical protein